MSEVKTYTLDTKGLRCPEPVMMLHNVVRDAMAGDKIIVVATDPSTVRDIPKFCTFLGHPLLESRQEGELFIFELQKATP
ncbi:MAG: tRNA 2-thiouridine synthesizing protein A [Flavobacteriales bacterium]|jgi:tRNA 2-thiouridine synthesizing protein A